MMERKTVAIVILTTHLMMGGCSRPSQPMRETLPEAQPVPAAQPPAAPEPPEKMPALPPPTLAEIREAIKRIYADAVSIEAGRSSVVGDFNGDFSQDIAIVVRPSAGKVEEINGELATWILGDPQKTNPPDPKKSVHRFPAAKEPVHIEQGDVLLAVIHGYGPEGWRNREANQTFLLRNAALADMRPLSPMNIQKAAGKNGNPPTLRGDVMRGRLAGEKGFLYWTGANYAWHR
ncbi:MAG TPA: hypothetical protein VNO70_08905 [Blastocatellia bacterium]|nr:hypothetical protein [Blastocatellia bacterium]